MKKWLTLLLALALLLSASALAETAPGFHAEGLPIVDEPIHLSVLALFHTILNRSSCLSFQRQCDAFFRQDFIDCVKERAHSPDPEISTCLIDDLFYLYRCHPEVQGSRKHLPEFVNSLTSK